MPVNPITREPLAERPPRPTVEQLLDSIRHAPIGDSPFWQHAFNWCIAPAGSQAAAAAQPLLDLLGHIRDRLLEHNVLVTSLERLALECGVSAGISESLAGNNTPGTRGAVAALQCVYHPDSPPPFPTAVPRPAATDPVPSLRAALEVARQAMLDAEEMLREGDIGGAGRTLQDALQRTDGDILAGGG